MPCHLCCVQRSDPQVVRCKKGKGNGNLSAARSQSLIFFLMLHPREETKDKENSSSKDEENGITGKSLSSSFMMSLAHTCKDKAQTWKRMSPVWTSLNFHRLSASLFSNVSKSYNAGDPTDKTLAGLPPVPALEIVSSGKQPGVQKTRQRIMKQALDSDSVSNLSKAPVNEK